MVNCWYVVDRIPESRVAAVGTSTGSLIRSADIDEHLISLFKFHKILDRQLFVALDADEAAIVKTLAKAFQLDTEEFEDKLELAKISKAWSTAKVQSDTKRKVDAVQKAQGEPVQLLNEVTSRRNLGSSTHPSSRARATSKHSKRNWLPENSGQRPQLKISARPKKKSRGNSSQKPLRHQLGRITDDPNPSEIPLGHATEHRTVAPPNTEL